jgi:hypothetical protein
MAHNNGQTNIEATSPFVATLRAAFSHKPFVVAVIIMATAAFGIGAATGLLKLSFRKQPVALTKALEEIPSKCGPWVQISTDARLESDMEHTLGTEKYVFRYYVDSRIVDKDKIAEILAKPEAEKQQALGEIGRMTPRAVVNFAVTYYTGMVDTVAHVPDRCYIADGYTPSAYEDKKWKLAGGRELEVRFITFEDATGFGLSNRVTKNVAYFFQVNGKMESSPLAVRAMLQDLTKADVYYAKVELMMTRMGSRDESGRVMADFLSYVLPEVQRCLPQAGREGGPTTLPAVASK